MSESGPARLAAIDQELAALSDRLDRHARAIMRGDAVCACIAAALIVVVAVARPTLYRWEFVALLAAVAIGCGAGFVQGLMLRSYRAEIRDLRSRVPR